MTPSNTVAIPLPRPVALLGYAGLLPFAALAAAAWLAPVAYRAQAAFGLLAYGATIASFLGAIHWGLAMRGAQVLQPAPFAWGVFPSLIAWLALLLGVCLAVDWRSYPAYGLGAWLTMRLHLTTVAVVCLVAGSAAA